MGALNVVRGIVGGLDQATGNDDGAAQMQAMNARDHAEKAAALRSQIVPHSLAIQGLQTKLASLDPKDDADAYNATVNQIQDNIHAMRDILHPDAKLGLSDWLQTHTTDRIHITNHDKRVRDLAAQNAQNDATNDARSAEATAALAQGVVPWEQTAAAKLEDAKAQAALNVANAKAKAMGLGTRPVPYYAGAINKTQALDTAKAGKVYKDGEGNEIDVTKIPDGMFLLPVFAGGGKEYYELGTDKGRYETGNNQRQFQPAVGGPVANPQTVGAVRVPTASSSTSTDSMGVTTNTNRVSSPVTPGGTTAAPAGPRTQSLRSVQSGGNVVTPSAGAAVPGMLAPGNVDLSKRPNIDNGDGTHSTVFSMGVNIDGKEMLIPGVGDGTTYPLRKLTTQEAIDQYRKTGKNLGTFADPKSSDAYAQTLHEDQARGNRQPQRGARTAPVPSGSAPLTLDADGHIPANDGSNAQLRTAANRLLDGADPKDLQIPARDKGPAQELAGRYGWQQGQFTPKEKMQINVATNFLQQLQNSPSLSVLDSLVSREKIRHVLDPKGGFIADLAAKNMTPQEAEFVRNYNAAVGTVQGLSSITRANRPVEAGVKRLMAELPNVVQSAGSDDAKKRIGQLLKEVDIASVSPNRPQGAKSRTLTQTKSLADRLAEALP